MIKTITAVIVSLITFVGFKNDFNSTKSFLLIFETDFFAASKAGKASDNSFST